jgi:hypothetical protein
MVFWDDGTSVRDVYSSLCGTIHQVRASRFDAPTSPRTAPTM